MKLCDEDILTLFILNVKKKRTVHNYGSYYLIVKKGKNMFKFINKMPNWLYMTCIFLIITLVLGFGLSVFSTPSINVSSGNGSTIVKPNTPNDTEKPDVPEVPEAPAYISVYEADFDTNTSLSDYEESGYVRTGYYKAKNTSSEIKDGKFYFYSNGADDDTTDDNAHFGFAVGSDYTSKINFDDYGNLSYFADYEIYDIYEQIEVYCFGLKDSDELVSATQRLFIRLESDGSISFYYAEWDKLFSTSSNSFTLRIDFENHVDYYLYKYYVNDNFLFSGIYDSGLNMTNDNISFVRTHIANRYITSTGYIAVDNVKFAYQE